MGEIKKIGVDYGRYNWQIAAMYGGCAIGNKVCLFRRGYSEVYFLDILSGELCMTEIVDNEVCLDVSEYFWHWRVQQYKGEKDIILYDKIHHILYQYSLETSETVELVCFKAGQELIDFVSDAIYVWVLCSNGIIYKLENSQIIDEYKYDICEGANFTLYCCKNVVYVVDINTGRLALKLSDDNTVERNITIPENNAEVVLVLSDNTKIIIQWRDGFFWYYDSENEVSGFLESSLTDMPSEAFFPDDTICENEKYSLQKLLDMLEFQPSYLRSVPVKNLGGKIYCDIALEN